MSYKDDYADAIEGQFYDLENRIMQDIIRRIRKTDGITSTADWQITRLQALGYSSEDIEQTIMKAMNVQYPDMFKLYDDVVEKEYVRNKAMYEQINGHFVPYEKNEQLQQLIEAARRQTVDTLKNITQSIGFVTNVNGQMTFFPLTEYYQKTLTAATLDIASGAFDYNSTLKKTVREMTNSGVRTVEYLSDAGRATYNRITVAARRAVMTGVSQVTGRISEMNAEKLGTEYFEIAWHSGARPTHREWQGKVWSKEQLVTVCGLGTVTGLLGANCYHEYYPFFKGISERQWSNEWLKEQNVKEDTRKSFKGKEYNLYEATQRQRQMETAMRAQREKVSLLKQGKANPDDILLERCRYQAQLSEYGEFSRHMGIKQQRERIYIDGLGRVAPGKRPENIAKVSGPKASIRGAMGDIDMLRERRNFVKRMRIDGSASIAGHKAKVINSIATAQMKMDPSLNALMQYDVTKGTLLYNPKISTIDLYDMDYLFAHEGSHIQDILNYTSWKSKRFKEAVAVCEEKAYNDKVSIEAWFQRGGKYENSQAISDIVDALSEGAFNVPVGHGVEYWEKNAHNKYLEIFANVSAIDVADLKERELLFKELFEAYEEIIK